MDVNVTTEYPGYQHQDDSSSDDEMFRPRENQSLITHSNDLSQISLNHGAQDNGYGAIEGGILEDSTTSSVRSVAFKVYLHRWVMLIVFSCFNAVQGYLNNIWPVVANSTYAVYGWNQSTIESLMFLLYVSYLAAMFPMASLVSKKGLHSAWGFSIVILNLGAIMRTVWRYSETFEFFADIGQICTGMAGPIAFTGGAILSSQWFEPSKRTSATALGTISGYVGAASAFLIGPHCVDSPITAEGETLHNFNSFHLLSSVSTKPKNFSSIINIKEMESQLESLRFYEMLIAISIFVMYLVFTRNLPPTPPSQSAAVSSHEKPHTYEDLMKLVKNGNFWMVALSAGISSGLYGIWAPMLDIILEPLHVTQKTAGYMGFYASIAGCVAAVAISIVADRFQGHYKCILLFLSFTSAVSCGSFVAILYIPLIYTKVGLYIALISLGITVNASIPLYYEMAIEKVYPIPEVMATGMITVIYNTFPALFLCVGMSTNITGGDFMNYTLCIGLALCVPLLYLFTENYRRLNVDNRPQLDNENINEVAEDA